MERASKILIILSLLLWLVRTAPADVKLTKDGDVIVRLDINNNQGRLSIHRSLWNCTQVQTAAQIAGKKTGVIGQQSLIDPFMYNCKTITGDGEQGGYWNKPEIWNRWKISVIKDASQAKANEPKADVVSLTADIPEWGVRKEVTISVPAGESRAYVYSRLTATKDVELVHDRQCTYASTLSKYRFYLDGRTIEPRGGAAIRRWIMAYRPEADISFALIMLDRKLQEYPGSGDFNKPFGSLSFHLNDKANGADISWGKGGGFLAKGEQRVQQYMLLWGDGDLHERVAEISKKALAGDFNPKVFALAPPPTRAGQSEQTEGLTLARIKYGHWLPIRMQPTTSPAIYQHSTYISPANARRARKVLEGLRDRKPMVILRGEFGRLIVGAEDGLIQGMRPALLSSSFQGSYLREYSPDDSPKGALTVTEQTSDYVKLFWKADASERKLTVYRNGLIRSSWTNPPKRLWIITGGHPYHYLATSMDSVVRFSQLLQRRRRLNGPTRLALFGYRDATLEIAAQNLQARSEEVWLDSGEVGWEWAMAYLKNRKNAKGVDGAFFHFMSRSGALTYLAGGAVRVVKLDATASSARVDYRIGTSGTKALELFDSPNPFAATEHAATKPPQEQPALPSIRAAKTKLWTVRLWPNHFNGWELRPLVLAHHNPQPVFYKLVVANPTDAGRRFQLALSRADWIEGAWIESDRERWETQVGSVALWNTVQPFWSEGGEPIVTVPANGEETVLVKVQPLEDTLGRYSLTLEWSAGGQKGSVELSLVVKPNILVDPYGAAGMAPEDFRYWGNVGGAFPPLYFFWYGYDLTPEEQERFHRAQRAQAQREGRWVRDHAYLRSYITTFVAKSPQDTDRHTKFFLAPPEKFVEKLKQVLIVPKYLYEHRVRLYLADEIWEILGGYKGRRYMPIPEVARWTKKLIMDSPTPCWYSFMQGGVDNQYQCKLPNDIAELFYYCGRDEGFRAYVRKLVEPRKKLFEQWRQDPALIKRAGTDKPRQIMSFWISGQLHVTDYPTMRRQHWYSRFHGIDSILMWHLSPSDMVYAKRIGCNTVMATGSSRAVLMTDRGLAWHDLHEDTALITLVRMLEEKSPPAEQQAATRLEQDAYEASQGNDFDLARHYLARAARTLDPSLANVFCRDFYRPIAAEPLPNILEEDTKLETRPKKRAASLARLKGRRPAPVLDGALDNSYLEEGVTLGNFLLLNENLPASEQTAVYLARDDENLYVLFKCNESQMAKIVAKRDRGRDEGTWQDDCVEVFIDRSRDGVSFDQLIIGAGGGRYDSRSRKRMVGDGIEVVKELEDWNPEWQATILKHETGWSAEIVIPFASIGGQPRPGEVWGMNFCREQQPKKELSTWSPMQGAFGTPQQFGEVKFP